LVSAGVAIAAILVAAAQESDPPVVLHATALETEVTANAALLVGQVITQESYPVAGVTSPRADTVVAVGVVVVHPSVVQSPALVLAVQVFTVHPTPSAKVW